MTVDRLAEILNDIKSTYEYLETWAEINTDKSITVLRLTPNGDEYLFGTKPETLEIDYVHWRRNHVKSSN